jgi:3-dehydroquinate dehydratase I
MSKPRICAVIVDNDIASIKKVEPLVDLFEVRIDLIGEDWQSVVKKLSIPWIACNRSPLEGGKGEADEAARIDKLLQAVESGADIVDVELRTVSLANTVARIKPKARCLISFHDLIATPSLEELIVILARQVEAGADICKVITTARHFRDNLTVLKLVKKYEKKQIVAFAMGGLGVVSRVLSPLVGGDFTYASIVRGRESAPGQITVDELKSIYETMKL